MFSQAFAQEVAATAASVPGQEQSMLASFVPLILIMLIFYMLILRPQQKRYKQHQAMIQSVKKGDKVVTGGGIIGKVARVDDKEDILHVEIADAVTIQVARSTLSSVYGKDNAKQMPVASAAKPAKKQTANDN